MDRLDYKIRNTDQEQMNHRYLTQVEVADRFRVTPSTVVNWRERGLLKYFQAPGSRRVLYPADAIEEFERQSIHQEREVIKLKKVARERPEISPRHKKEWRI